MGMKSIIIIIIGTIFALVIAQEQEDSLRGALNAINRRQRDLSDYGRYEDTEYGYPMNRPDDLDFLKPSASDYVDEDEENEYKKKVYSAFRERLAQDRQKQLDEMAQNVLLNMDNEDYNNEDDYKELLHDLWEKYQKNIQNNYYDNADINIAKRYRYPNFGLDGVGLRKRNRYYDSDSDSYYMLNYVPSLRNRMSDDRNEDDIDYSRARYWNHDRKFNKRRQFNLQKRFPVKKRSSSYEKPITAEKRSTNKRQTDPKVEKDLSNIFGIQTTSSSSTTVSPVTKKSTTVNKDKQKQPVENAKEGKATNKEVITETNIKTDKPLQIKKKSINWSDYFGLDRRKKSEHSDINKEWLLNRYHKAVAIADKQNTEYPLKNFRNHDAVNKKDDKAIDSEENKIKEMDMKLQNMEDAIVDDALKYTGAHEGSTDPKEIQQVKDRVISRLAAAYSLEKMRNALDEYKLAMSKEHETYNRGDQEEYLTEKKRTSVPRKQAVDESRKNVPEADNNIKCAHGVGEDCQEQNYRTPSEIFEYQYGSGECPTIQKACNDMGMVVGAYGKVLEKACGIQQLCLLCNNNSWFSPTRQCNRLFLEKAYDLCQGKEDCRREAQRSLPYLAEVSRSLQSQPQLADECELSCPNNEGDFAETPDAR